MQRSLPRFRSMQFFICEIFGEILCPNLYGDAMLVPIQMAPTWRSETNRNMLPSFNKKRRESILK